MFVVLITHFAATNRQRYRVTMRWRHESRRSPFTSVPCSPSHTKMQLCLIYKLVDNVTSIVCQYTSLYTYARHNIETMFKPATSSRSMLHIHLLISICAAYYILTCIDPSKIRLWVWLGWAVNGGVHLPRRAPSHRAPAGTSHRTPPTSAHTLDCLCLEIRYWWKHSLTRWTCQ